MKKQLLITFFFCLMSSSTMAFNSLITKTYLFGNGDSKVTAEKILLESIKQEAANQAGVYIQSDKSLTSSGYTDSIKMISASIVKLEIKNRQTGVKKDGTFYLKITAKATVNEEVLIARIKAIQNDKSKDKLIKILQQEQLKLRSKLRQSESRLQKKNLTQFEVSKILSEQSELSDKITANFDAVGQVFKRGSLLSMAKRASNTDEKINQEFQKKYRLFWEEQNKRLKASVHEVREESPNKYKLTIKVEMDNLITIKMADIVSLPYKRLKPHAFKKLNRNSYVYGVFNAQTIKSLKNKDRKNILARLNYISNHPVFLSVGTSSQIIKIHFFGGFRKGFFSDSPYTSSNKGIDFKEFREASNGINYTKEIIAFKNESHDDRIYRKNGQTNSFFFDIFLSKDEAESTNKIVAKFTNK